MGRGIYKQPNGRYAIFSSISDFFIYYNATKQDLIDFLVAEEKERIQENIERVVSELDADSTGDE